MSDIKTMTYLDVLADQIRTIDKIRIIKKFSSLTDKEIHECKRVIRETFID